MICSIWFKRTDDRAVLPTKNNSDDTGLDVYAIEDVIIPARGSAIVKTGLDFAFIEPGYWIRVEGRSGLGWKHGIIPHPGIIDNGYRGDASIKLYNNTDKYYQISAGDRIAQFVIYSLHKSSVMFVENAVESERGTTGFGSSGK